MTTLSESSEQQHRRPWRAWVLIVLGLLTVANVRLVTRGVSNLCKAAPSVWNPDWHARHMPELLQRLPPDAIVCYRVDPQLTGTNALVDFDWARFYLAPLRVTAEANCDWLILHASDERYFPTDIEPTAFVLKFDLADGIWVYRRKTAEAELASQR